MKQTNTVNQKALQFVRDLSKTSNLKPLVVRSLPKSEIGLWDVSLHAISKDGVVSEKPWALAYKQGSLYNIGGNHYVTSEQTISL